MPTKNPEQDFDNLENQGEGNKTAARDYNDKASEHARSGKPAKKAKEAAESVDQEGDELREAETEGKARVAEEDPEFRR